MVFILDMWSGKLIDITGWNTEMWIATIKDEELIVCSY